MPLLRDTDARVSRRSRRGWLVVPAVVVAALSLLILSPALAPMGFRGNQYALVSMWTGADSLSPHGTYLSIDAAAITARPGMHFEQYTDPAWPSRIWTLRIGKSRWAALDYGKEP